MSTNKLILAGQKLSNICYNMKQNEALPEHVRDSMEECVKEWDEAYKEYRDDKDWNDWWESLK